MHGGVCGGARRYAEVHGGCAEVHRGVCGGVHGGAWRFFKEVVGKKNQDFMLIRFLNAGI